MTYRHKKHHITRRRECRLNPPSAGEIQRAFQMRSTVHTNHIVLNYSIGWIYSAVQLINFFIVIFQKRGSKNCCFVSCHCPNADKLECFP